MASLTETATRNLKAELARHDKTPKDLAKAWGLEIRAVNNRLKGHTPLSTDEIEKRHPCSTWNPKTSSCSSSSRSTASNNSKPKEHRT